MCLLTIVIPTQNRPKYIRRTVNYWEKFDCKIIIYDGSDKINTCLTKKKKIIYLYCKNKNIHDRILELSEKVKTKYVLFSGDDEFYSQVYIKKYIDFLENNKSFISCVGNAISFDLKNKALKFLLSYNRNKKNYSVKYFYSLNRTKIWKKNIKKAISYDKFSDIFSIGEYIFEFLMYISGPVKIFNEIFWYRSLENPPLPARKIKYLYWWNSISYNNKKKFLLTITSKKNLEIGFKYFKDLYKYFKNKKNQKPSVLRRIIFKLLPITYVKMYSKSKILVKLRDQKNKINIQEFNYICNLIKKI